MKYPYISGPMTTYRYHNFPAFYAAEKTLRERGYSPVNPAASGPGLSTWDRWEDAYDHALKHPQKWDYYIHRDVQLVLHSDGIVMLDGWEASKGACLELVLAVSFGYPVLLYRSSTGELEEPNKAAIYASALSHLADCGLNGVELTDSGYAKYV